MIDATSTQSVTVLAGCAKRRRSYVSNGQCMYESSCGCLHSCMSVQLRAFGHEPSVAELSGCSFEAAGRS